LPQSEGAIRPASHAEVAHRADRQAPHLPHPQQVLTYMQRCALLPKLLSMIHSRSSCLLIALGYSVKGTSGSQQLARANTAVLME
jgi:hypothetical protein